MNFPVTYQKHSSGLLQECCLEVEPGVLGTDLENLQNVENSSTVTISGLSIQIILGQCSAIYNWKLVFS